MGTGRELSRRRLVAVTAGGAAGSGLLAGLTGRPTRGGDGSTEGDRLHVGAGAASLAWRAGARPGQVGTGGGTSLGREPYPYTTTSAPGSGIHSEPTAKAIVLETGGERYALVKTDTYLFHEQAHRRIADLIEPLGIPRSHLLVAATHNHSAPHAFSTGLAMGLFADSFDPRHWSYVTRQTATAIERAVSELRPGTVRAIEGSFDGVQENIIGPSEATEKALRDTGEYGWGTDAEYPVLTEGGEHVRAGFPPEHFEEQFVLLRFDTPDGEPIAATLTLGMHPESLRDGHGLTSAEYVGIVERELEDHVGGDFVAAYLMGPLGDIEPSRGEVGKPDWWRQTFGRMEEMADHVATEAIRLYETAETADIPDGTDRERRPSTEELSARRITGRHTPPDPIEEGEEIVLAYGRSVDVDMASVRLPPPSGLPGPSVSYLSQEFGSGWAMPATGLAFETASPLLTAVKVGGVLLATYPGEPISDVSYNFRTRVTTGFSEVYQGYHWPENPGWVRDRIAENFSTNRLEDGYDIAAVLSMGNQSIGYFVTRWEFENRNHYRQSLTPFGAGSTEYVSGSLLGLARELQGGPEATTRSSTIERVDRVRRTGTYAGLAVADESAVPAYHTLVRPDGATAGEPREHPSTTGRFERATFTWVGGTNAVDVPRVRLEREDADGWTAVADSRGHELVVTTGHSSMLSSPTETLDREREWNAVWEVPWDAQTGRYRFVVAGTARSMPGAGERSEFDPLGADTEYRVVSESFLVEEGALPLSDRFTDVHVEDGQLEAQLAFEPARRAIERPPPGTELPVTLEGTGEEVVATYDVEGFVLEAELPPETTALVIDRGAYVDEAGNPTESVRLSL